MNEENGKEVTNEENYTRLKRFKKFFEGFNTQIKKVIDSLHNAFITANQLIIEAAGRLTSV